MSGAVGPLASASASAGAGASAAAAAGAAMASAPAGAVGGMSTNYLKAFHASVATRSLLAIASLQPAAFLLRVLTQGWWLCRNRPYRCTVPFLIPLLLGLSGRCPYQRPSRRNQWCTPRAQPDHPRAGFSRCFPQD